MEINFESGNLTFELEGSQMESTNNHASLQNLDYEHSGHTGFASSTQLAGKVDKVTGKGLSTNDFTTEEKTKLAGIANSATKVTKTSDITNDSGFITSSYHDSTKQNTLTAGQNITIQNDVISATGGTRDFDVLTNRPSYNGSEMTHDTNIPAVPTKTSDLTNDSGFIDDTYHDSSKQDTLVSGTNIKTINNNSILGSGDITIESGEQLIFSVENDGSGTIQMTSSNISSIAKAVLEGKKGEQSSIIVGKKPVDSSYAYGPKVLNMIQLVVNTTYVIASFAGYKNDPSDSYYEILGIKYRSHTYLGYDFYIPRAEYDSGNITHIYGDSGLTSTSVSSSRSYGVYDVVDAIFNGPLSSNNTSSYTPTGDYNPATKKYVDTAVGNIETALTTIISGGGVQ